MAKANITLPNGTIVTVEGSLEEIQRILDHYSGKDLERPQSDKRKKTKKAGAVVLEKTLDERDGNKNLTIEIAKKVKECDEGENIEENVLDRTSMVDRTLLPLYILAEYIDEAEMLTSGDIARVAKQLGLSIHVANISNTLTGAARKYVVAHTERKKGSPAKYSISRAGRKYLKNVIAGSDK